MKIESARSFVVDIYKYLAVIFVLSSTIACSDDSPNSKYCSFTKNELDRLNAEIKSSNNPYVTELIGNQELSFPGTRKWETYFSIHNVKSAQLLGKGQGVKVGILDWGFGYQVHSSLYSGGLDFVNNKPQMNTESWHGFWMARTLREIAPKCEIFALQVISLKEAEKVNALKRAFKWAVINKIDVLTYSGPPFSSSAILELRPFVRELDLKGIVTTFIHYDDMSNIKPDGFFTYRSEYPESRPNDIDILHYDYSILLTKSFTNYSSLKKLPTSGEDIPFLSISSTSPVAAGFVAILKSINPSLTPAEYKEILIKTSRPYKYFDPFCQRLLFPSHVVDIGKAAEFLLKNKT